MNYWLLLPHQEISDALMIIRLSLIAFYFVLIWNGPPRIDSELLKSNTSTDTLIQGMKKHLEKSAENKSEIDSRIVCVSVIVCSLLEFPFFLATGTPLIPALIVTITSIIIWLIILAGNFFTSKMRKQTCDCMIEFIDKFGQVENHSFESEWPPGLQDSK